MTHAASTNDDLELLDQLARAHKQLIAQIGRRIIGQHEVVDNLVAALLGGGHALLVGVPGLAKTLLVQTVAQALDLTFSRVQFTPDLMPSDITGTEMLEEDHATGRRFFKFVRGPIFANVVLADEINRAPPKTQAALLQAMQEHAVTASGQTHALPEPFFVLATQNPIEQEGTYPLPEAQLDRFMMELTSAIRRARKRSASCRRRRATSRSRSRRCSRPSSSRAAASRAPAAGAAERRELRGEARALDAPRHARGDAGRAKKYVSWGAGPRASQYLILGAKAQAAMDGRSVPDLEDVHAMAVSVLRHRVVLNFQAEAEGLSVSKLIRLEE